jgi:hypothetical protein
MNAKLLIALTWTCLALWGQERSGEPKYTSDGQLMRPDDYREWIYLTSGLGMTYGMNFGNALWGQHFDNVFVSPQAYRSFLQTGKWPDKTVFVKEVRTSASKGSLNKGGHYQEDLVTIEAHVKDTAQFSTRSEFFVFGTAKTAKPLGAKSSCQTCHSQNGAVDSTFVQFYPTLLPIAKAKGTLTQRDTK